MKRTLLALVLCLTILSLCSVVFAAGPSVAKTQASQSKHVSNDAATGLKKIFSNFGPAGDLYDATTGYFVSGTDNGFNSQEQRIAIPFTPAKNATITKVQLALQYYGFGVNGAVAAIYKDSAGLPGKTLASKLLKGFDDFGTGCCDVANWKLATPLVVKKGVQYWVVANTNAKTHDSINTFDFVFDDAPGTFAFEQEGSGWILLNASLGYAPSAARVLGTIP